MKKYYNSSIEVKKIRIDLEEQGHQQIILIYNTCNIHISTPFLKDYLLDQGVANV